ncbi:MAG: zinc-ribbon domain-containing protein [Deltaproteobacteria bacterium]|nr:zinc-ribbon domain-containing protein [Deltaproteobacteria bacterium]
MEVTCGQCKSRFNIPDDKVPKDKVLKLNCPKCKGKISLGGEAPEQPAKADGSGEFRMKVIDPTAGRKTPEESYGYEDYAGDQALDFFEEGIKLALIMTNSSMNEDRLRSGIEIIGYKCIPTPNTRDAIGKLRFHHFDLIILADGFDNQPLDQSVIVNYLNRLSMSVRRKIFLALISDNYKTMDNMMAFAMSANVVVNSKDIEKLHLILKKAVSENERFYKIFMDTLVETGKA